MFNLYSSMNRRGGDEPEKPKELETTGHDRFCQSRSSRYEIFKTFCTVRVYPYHVNPFFMDTIWNIFNHTMVFIPSEIRTARNARRMCNALNLQPNSIPEFYRPPINVISSSTQYTIYIISLKYRTIYVICTLYVMLAQ